MEIKFNGIIIENLLINRSLDENADEMELKVSSGFDISQPTNFGIKFEISIIQSGWSYSVVAQSHFVASEKLSEDSGDEQLIKYNAPAIAYPYIRSMLSSISAVSGHPVINIPVINFYDFFKNGKSE